MRLISGNVERICLRLKIRPQSSAIDMLSVSIRIACSDMILSELDIILLAPAEWGKCLRTEPSDQQNRS